MVSETPGSNKITVNTAEQDHLVDAVTVFQAGRAEIKRRVQLELKKGQNHVDIEHLPSCIHEDSVRVQGSGTAVIFDVVYHSPLTTVQSYHTNDTPADDEEAARCYSLIQALRKERVSVEKLTDFLDLYGRTMNCQGLGLGDVESFLDMYSSRRASNEKRIQELDLQIGQAEKALREAQNKKTPQNVDEHGTQRRTKITVIVLAEAEGKAELVLTYVVSNASWTPTYDIRAAISQSPNTPFAITLHYRASITQTTGENWPEVALTLSTASPHLGTTMPTLSTWRIGLPEPVHAPQIIRVGSPSYSYQPHIIQVASHAIRSSSPSLSSRSCRSRSRSPTRIMTDAASARLPTVEPHAPPATMGVRQADTVDAGVLSASFSIPGRSDIPSDQTTHKVLIASLDCQAEPEWVCIPRKEESVFLRCTIVNSSEFTLLPGEASVFVDDNFVTKTRLQYVPPSESFKVPLGTDSAMRVTYAPVRTYNRTTTHSGFTFPGRQKDPKQKIMAYSQRITIRNSRTAAVPAVRVLDHVPVSNNSSVKVNVVSPRGLKNGTGSKEDVSGKRSSSSQLLSWVDLRKGVQARWAPVDVGGEGVVEWTCAIGAGKEIELELGWEVSAPVGTNWGTL